MATWGYLAVFAGVLVEGEVAYLSGIVFTELGRLSLYFVIALSFVGAVTRDLSIFLFTRRGGQLILGKSDKRQHRLQRLSDWAEARPDSVLVFYRFFYGTSTLIIMALALSEMTLAKYSGITIIGSFLWSLVYGTLGFFAAREIIHRIEWIQGHMDVVILTLIGGLLVYFAYNRWKKRKID